MREAVGTTWIFQLVLVFVLIFAAYLALTVNYSKSFRVKNEVLTVIEKNEGLTNKALTTINNYLYTNNYNQKGRCPDGWYGVSDLTSMRYEEVANKKYYWCFYKNTGYHTSMSGRAYYKIKMFFRFELPMIGQITTFDVDGQTYEMDNTYDGIS